jgi:hypothetical protein
MSFLLQAARRRRAVPLQKSPTKRCRSVAKALGGAQPTVVWGLRYVAGCWKVQTVCGFASPAIASRGALYRVLSSCACCCWLPLLGIALIKFAREEPSCFRFFCELTGRAMVKVGFAPGSAPVPSRRKGSRTQSAQSSLRSSPVHLLEGGTDRWVVASVPCWCYAVCLVRCWWRLEAFDASSNTGFADENVPIHRRPVSPPQFHMSPQVGALAARCCTF